MPLTRTTTLRLIKYTGALILAGIVIAYAIARSMDYLRGPHIQISWPSNGSSATSSIITIQGQADRVNKLTLNGGTVSTDEQGHWSQTIIIFPGLNKISVAAQDQFGRNTEVDLDILGTIDFPVKN